ncbi:MAG: hypothetical protein JSS07_05995 [Proteobacteria bacterium]|nr:hypothetical protein [Pseudomonadota bacterium]
MSSYSQRFHKHQKYITDLSEDILSYTICLPFTLSFLFSTLLADGISDVVSEDNIIDQWFYKPSKIILLMPNTILKGFISATIAPLLAFFLAFSSLKAPQYSYFLSQKFERYNMHSKLILYPLLFWFYPILLLGLLPFFVIANRDTVSMEKYKKRADISDRARIVFIAMPIVFYEFVILKQVFSFMLPFWISVLSPFSLSILSCVAVTCFLVGYNSLGLKLSNVIDKIIVKAQDMLHKRGISTYKNKEDISLNPIIETSAQELFVSNSNHAFNLLELEDSVQCQGFKNYYTQRQNELLDKNDITRLENHPNINKFPALKQHILQSKKTSLPCISEKSLEQLDKFAHELVLSQDDHKIEFSTMILQAKETLYTYLGTISSEERKAILKLNLLGSTNPNHEFENVINKMLEGNSCKKEVNRLILNKTDSLRKMAEDVDMPSFQPFWQGNLPRAIWS